MMNSDVSYPTRGLDPSLDDGHVVFRFAELAAITWRAKWLIGGCTALGLAFGIWQGVYKTVPQYGSDAQIVLETRDQQVLDLDNILGNLSNSQEALQTETLILNGRRLMGLVVDRLDLTQDPEFNPALIPATNDWMQTVTQTVTDLLPLDRTIQTTAPATIDANAGSQARVAAISALQKQVTIRNIPGTYAFSIWAVTQDPYKSQKIAETVAQTYIDDQLATKYDATLQARTWLADQVSVLENELARAEQDLARLSDANDFASDQTIAALENRIAQLRGTLEDKTRTITQYRDLMHASTTATDNATRVNIARAVGLATLDGSTTISARDWAETQKLLVSAEQDARTKAEALQSTIAALETDLSAQKAAIFQMQDLERATQAKRAFYENLRSRLQETSVQTHLQKADSRITSHAVLLQDPISPNKTRLAAMGAFFGAAIGLAFVLFTNMRNPKVTTASRLSALTNLPVLASLPRFPFRTRIQKIPLPGSATADGEAVRALRNALVVRKGCGANTPCVIMLTSASSGEGKTTIATALAASFGQVGKKVLLIDCDTRRSLASLRLAQNPEYGLADILFGQCSLQQAVVPTDLDGLDLLPAMSGRDTASVIDALNHGSLDHVFEQARQFWDVIILDTPPAMVISDTLLLSEKADIRLLLASCAQSSETEVMACVHRMRQLGQGPDALVINKSRTTGDIYGKGRQSRSYFRARLAA